jgi:tetratricopeptide (TPR) repeat protein
VTGPVGVGKSRLAREALREALHEGSLDAALIVDLSNASPIESLATQLGADTLQAVPSRLSALGTTAVLLDNADQAADGLVATLEPWRQIAPEVVFVVTTRHLPEDATTVVDVPPLSIENGVRLFLEVARLRQPDLQPTPRLMEIVAAVDGLPLAVELAASRVRALSIGELADRLAHKEDVLRRGTTSFRASVMSAVEELDRADRRALSALTVFRGGFSVRAAEQVVSAAVADLDALDAIERLRDDSWLHPAGAGRLALYPSLREVISAAHPAPETAALAHAVAVLQQVSHQDKARREAVLAEQQNLEVIVASGSPEQQVEAVLALGMALPPEAASHHLETVWLHASDAQRPALALARGRALRLQGRTADAQDLLEPLTLDPDLAADAWMELGQCGSGKGALDALRAAEAAYLEDGDPTQAARALRFAGQRLRAEGRLDEAETILERVLTLTHAGPAVSVRTLKRLDEAVAGEQAGERRQRLIATGYERFTAGDAFVGLALIRIERGELAEAEAQLRDGLAAVESRSWPATEAALRMYLGVCMLLAGEVVGAVRVLSRASEQAAASLKPISVLSDGYLALGLCYQGRKIEAMPVLQPALALHQPDPRTPLGAFLAVVQSAVRDREAPTVTIDAPDARLALALVNNLPATSSFAANLSASVSGLWFKYSGGERVDVSRRAAPSRILAALVAAYKAKRGLSLENLVEAGWPGERIVQEAAAARAYVAVSTLRRLGLRPVLLHKDGLYRLDPKIPLAIETP